MKIGFCYDIGEEEYRRECIVLDDNSRSKYGRYRCQYVCPSSDELEMANFQCFEEAPPEQLPHLTSILRDYVYVTKLI